MVVDDLDVDRALPCPHEADPVSLIDADAVLTAPVPAKGLEPVARRNSKVLEGTGGVNLLKLAPGDKPDLGRTNASSGLRLAAVEEILGPTILERPDHGLMVARLPCYVNPRVTIT